VEDVVSHWSISASSVREYSITAIALRRGVRLRIRRGKYNVAIDLEVGNRD
jgi:hypothetical protein